MDLSNVEDYHWIKSSKVPKRVIVKLSRGTLIKYVDQKKVWGVWTYHHSVLTQRSTSTVVYVPITKCCGLNVGKFCQINIFTLFERQMAQSS